MPTNQKQKYINHHSHTQPMKCKKCNTENGYFRLETKEWICRKCGTITKIKEYKEKHQDE